MIQVITQLDKPTQASIGQYLASRTQAGSLSGPCLEQDPRWLTVLHKGLGHRPYILIAREQEADHITGYLPLMLVTGKLFGRFLVSLPYLNRAGLLADNDTTGDALIDRAVSLADELKVRYLELRHTQTFSHKALSLSRSDKALMVLELPTDAQTLWQTIGPKVRNQVRKADKQSPEIKWGSTELLDDFYHIFSVNMRDLGTPVYPRKLFEQTLSALQDNAQLAVVRLHNQPIAAAMLVLDPLARIAQVPSASALRAFNFTNANMWMYHKLLLRAIEQNMTQFDFGRSSPDSGTYRFKKQWGAKPHDTVWQYYLRQGDINAVRPDSPKYQRRIATWQKLPVWVTRLIGPAIVRGIP